MGSYERAVSSNLLNFGENLLDLLLVCLGLVFKSLLALLQDTSLVSTSTRGGLHSDRVLKRLKRLSVAPEVLPRHRNLKHHVTVGQAKLDSLVHGLIGSV